MNKDEIFEKEATYVSPITVKLHEIQRNYNRKLDTLILNEIRKYDVKVDKDELVKALKYDRNQYEKGYANGKKDAAEKILTTIYRRIRYATFQQTFALEVVKHVANELEIELE